MFFPIELRGVEYALDGLSQRFQASATNLANIQTPGYQRQIVDFEDSLSQAIAASEVDIDPGRPMEGSLPDPTQFLSSWVPQTRMEERRSQRVDGNGVSIEHEMANVTKSAMKFNLLATWVASEYRTLKFVIDAR